MKKMMKMTESGGRYGSFALFPAIQRAAARFPSSTRHPQIIKHEHLANTGNE
jgi:hypothetical protein